MHARVLVVDDDEDYNEMIADTLSINGFQTNSAHDGREAIEAVRLFSPQLIITDIIMPDEDGIGLLMKLQDQIIDGDIKVLAISGGGRVAGSDYLTIAKNFGATDVLEKPFSSSDLLEKVRGLVE